jgi:N-acetyl-anhydromuramyl-L-alanine amidase AmpD
MGIPIERVRWDRTRFHPPGNGYWRRNDPDSGKFRPPPNRILIHTTNGPKGQSFTSCADWLARDGENSAHYLVGRSGQIARILHPLTYIAWAAGTTVAGWGNYETINIECQWVREDGTDWPRPMLDSLTLLVLELCTITDYPIGDLRIAMDTHRAVATPPGRKRDPDGFDDNHFATWRELVQCRREQ